MVVPLIPSALVAVVAITGVAAWCQLVSYLLLSGVLVCAVLSVAGVILGQRAVYFLGAEEQLVVEGFTGTTVTNGPAVATLNPFGYRAAARRNAVTLASDEYCKVQDAMDGSERMERGPRLLFLGPYEQVKSTEKAKSLQRTDYLLVEDKLTGKKSVVKGPCMWFPTPHESAQQQKAVSLSGTEYITVEDKLSGDKKIVRGPCVWFPEPYDHSIGQKEAIALQEDEYVLLKDASSGERWVQRGKALVFLEPTWQVEGTTRQNKGVMKAWCLKISEYVRLVDSVSGKVTVHRGEKTVFPGPDESLVDGNVCQALDLKVDEYVKLMNQATGEVRVERGGTAAGGGNKLVFLEASDLVVDGQKRQALVVDEEQAVLVRDKATGQVRLVTEQQLFVPGPNEIIEEVRKLIRLADHEAMILKGSDGDFQFFYGSEERRPEGQPRSFFLPPFTEVVKLCWSRGRRREKRDLFIERFDCRPQFMSFEFNCRTSDNVELILEGTFFWEVVDLPAMVKSTGDTSGDLCNHARSQFIRHVARVTLKEFMDQSHQLARKVWEDDTQFYGSRGVKIHSLEVTRYQCADSRTSEILEQIIQETTNRMNRLSQAESENEVKLFKMQGQIEQERMNGDLLKIQHEHSTDEAEVTGSSEAACIRAFMDGLKVTVPDSEKRLAMWQVLRKTEALDAVTTKGSTLFFTPSSANLSIESGRT